MKRELENSLRSLLVELVLYTGLVTGYFFLVLHLLGDWLHYLFERDHRVYAGVALALIIGQGVLLDVLTHTLLKLIKPRTED